MYFIVGTHRQGIIHCIPWLYNFLIEVYTVVILDHSNRQDTLEITLIELFTFSGELFLSFVVSARPHAKILRTDASEALKMKGVHSFVDHTDIPGRNLFGPRIQDEEFFASDEVRFKYVIKTVRTYVCYISCVIC